MRYNRKSIASLLICTAAVTATAIAQDYEYEFVELPTLGGATLGVDINQSNVIAGHSWTPGPFYAGWPHAFTYDHATTTIIDLGPVTPGYDSFAGGINDHGHVAGFGRLGLFDPNRGFVQIGATKTILPTVGGDHSYANIVNNAGRVVGAAEDENARRRAVVWDNAVPTDLGDLGGSWAEATNINEQDQILGWSELTPGGTRHAFLYENGIMTDISGSFGGWILPFGLNEHGDCVGYIYDPRFFPWANIQGTPMTLNDVGFGGAAWDINDGGVIVGFINPAPGVRSRAAVWASFADDPIDLNNAIDPLPDFELNSATGINEAGWIVGWGTRISDEESLGFLLIPKSAGPTLTVTASCPGGGPIRIDWEGATPDAPIALLGAATTGSFTIPSGYPCAGTTLGIGSNRLTLVYQGRSDATGAGTLNRNAGAGVCGGKLQLVDISTCNVSNVAVIE